MAADNGKQPYLSIRNVNKFFGGFQALKNVSLDTTIGELPFFKGRGCDDCNGMGMKGRQGLYEVMLMTPAIRKLVTGEADDSAIREQAYKDGMKPLRVSGAMKIASGLTTADEVMKVAPLA